MERLLYSSSTPPTLKLHSSIPKLLLPRLPVRLHSPGRLCCFSKSNRVVSVSCNYENDPSSHSSKLPPPTPLLANSEDGLASKSDLFNWVVANEASKEQKATTIGMFMLITSLTMCVINPIFTSPAFAALQTTVETGVPGAVTIGAKLMRIGLLSSAWTGFLAGCLHTLSGPDHLAALAPLSIGRSPMESAAVGALWGCGHDAGQVMFGLLFLLLKDRLHIEIIRTWGTRVVALTLLAIGAMGIREATEIPAPCIAVQHADGSLYGALESTKKKKVGFATLATGIVHGLQPDALMMVLPALALPSKLAGAAFLVMFLVGTVVSMGSYTVFIGSCNEALKDRVPRITEKLTWASSLVAIALGFAIIISQIFGYSLY